MEYDFLEDLSAHCISIAKHGKKKDFPSQNGSSRFVETDYLSAPLEKARLVAMFRCQVGPSAVAG